MENSSFSVLFLVFNRPNTTQKVFDTIRRAQPLKLYIASDGPRFEKEGEIAKVEEVRKNCNRSGLGLRGRNTFSREKSRMQVGS